jgi:hypothetical protein
MKKLCMIKNYFFLLICLISVHHFCFSQNVPIDNYSVNGFGQAQLSIQAQEGKYYMLHAQHSSIFNWATSMTMGVNGTMVISDPAGAYPLSEYTVTEHDVASPLDYDGDGIDDITEFNNMPTDAPINYADAVAFVDGATSIPDAETFLDLAAVNNVGWAPFLDGQLYVKFGILDRDTPQPKIYFINSNTYTIHATFFNAIGATVNGDDSSGEIVFNPNDILPNGTIGSYSFNFSFGNAYNFDATQRTYELLAANMPFLQNNMNHFIGQADENDYLNNYATDFVDTRIEVVLESDVFAEINYIPFHEAEGYGFFKHMEDLSETPGSRDIVLYDALPNSLPRVGGIITSVIQTPLSHVNLRAIQDNVPNAYIADPLSIDEIANLLGNYIYYKVENEQYQIRAATLAEVNDWYEDLRPTEPQIPIRDLSFTDILPLDDIDFGMSSSYGAKCSNVATMRSFGLPIGTIPDGFGIPFYYYDEFMKFNNFYEEAQVMIDNPVFKNDLNFRIDRLKTFRRDIKDAPMPQWMLDNLQDMHDDFPEGTAVRCRSSTNNEDLPGFSGAGLYTSKTQHLDEGHISKSIKQVYASMWNFRAYEERDFYRVDHFIAAMGVLCHPNFQEEQSNGVGISIDPIYDTEGTFYLNTQVGESLITNPDPNSVPEEILLYQDPLQGGGYLVLRLSNLVDPGELVMDQIYLDQMREYLTVIHDEFEILYAVEGAEGFGMDIEYKVTAQDQLIIKQARPWVSFWADITANNDLGVTAILEPQSSSSLGSDELVTATIANHGLNDMSNFDVELLVDGQSMEIINIPQTIQPFSEADIQFSAPQDFSTIGDYDVTAVVSHVNDEYENNNTLNVVLSKVHELDGALSVGDLSVVCDGVVEMNAILTNHGDATITDVTIEVLVNDLVVDLVNATVDIPFQEEGTVTLTIDQNLQQINNNITLNLVEVNNLEDGDITNNTVSTTTTLDSDYDIVTLIINADNYPQETSWELYDEGANQMIASGSLQYGTDVFSQDICLDYSSCFSLYVYDSFGDGICCGYGEGDFLLLDAAGNTILANTGEFDSKVQEMFCLNETGCEITADINISHVTSAAANDGSITINTSAGLNPFQYSIDGGQTFFDSNTFSDLSTGVYDVYIQGALELCSYQETVSIDACTFSTVDIVATTVSSVVSTEGSIVITPTSGLSPYLYSIDGGQNFVTSNIFSNLAVGNYNVVVQDSLNICFYKVGVPIEVKESMVINEINFSSSEAFNPGDWIELYNPTPTPINVSNWQIKDNDDDHVFEIPAGTQIEGNGFLVFVKDTSDFNSIYPEISHIGDLGFGLGSSDAVRLYNSYGTLLDEVYYDSELPWPSCADETGNTLELISPDLDNLLPENWNCINENGSPKAINSNEPPVDDSNSIVVYPNPVENILYIKGNSETYNIEVYSLLGQLVTTAANVSEIDISFINDGIYLIKISTINSTITKQIIKF